MTMTKQRLTKSERARLQRAEALEAAIVATLKRFSAKLKMGDYITKLGQPGETCVCAIGAAVLSRVPEYCATGAARDLQSQMYSYLKVPAGTPEADWWKYIHMGPSNRRDMSAWAAGVVNDGITQEDLLQLEDGFEGVEGEAKKLVVSDETSPFWKLGRKLGRRALRER